MSNTILGFPTLKKLYTLFVNLNKQRKRGNKGGIRSINYGPTTLGGKKEAYLGEAEKGAFLDTEL